MHPPGKKEGLKAAIATDFDCDGIFSGYVCGRGLADWGLTAGSIRRTGKRKAMD